MPSHRPDLTALLTRVAVALAFLPVACRRNDHAGTERDPGASSSAVTAASASANPGASATASSTIAVAVPRPAASVLAMVNPQNLPAYAGPTGSVEGTVFVTGPAAPTANHKDFSRCPTAVASRGRVFREGPVPAGSRDGARPVADAMIGITGYAGYFVPETREVRKLVYEHCDEVARTIDMTFGQRLEVVNHTSTLVAPYLVELPAASVLVARSGGEPINVYPSRPGRFTLRDRMGGSDIFGANVYVVPWPLHATSNEAGHFRIDGVPVGSLTVSARLPALVRETSAPVEVKAGVVVAVELRIPFDGKVPGEDDAGAGDPGGHADNVNPPAERRGTSAKP